MVRVFHFLKFSGSERVGYFKKIFERVRVPSLVLASGFRVSIHYIKLLNLQQKKFLGSFTTSGNSQYGGGKDLRLNMSVCHLGKKFFVRLTEKYLEFDAFRDGFDGF